MNKTQEKQMVIDACKTTWEMREENETEWCQDGVVGYLQSIFPPEHKKLIAETIESLSQLKYKITLTVEVDQPLDPEQGIYEHEIQRFFNDIELWKGSVGNVVRLDCYTVDEV